MTDGLPKIDSLPKVLFQDAQLKAQVVHFPNTKRTSLKLSGAWHPSFNELYNRYECNNIWIYASEGGRLLEAVLASQLSSDLQLMGGFDNIHIIERAKYLRGLTITLTKPSKLDFSELELEKLSIQASLLKNYALLPPGLRTLFIIGLMGNDVRSIAYLPKLEWLRLSKAPKIECLDGLEDFKRLTRLEIYYAPHLSVISALTSCRNLETLVLDHCPAIYGIKVLAQLSKLKSLTLDSCGMIDSFGHILTLRSLKRLSFTSNTDVADGAIEQLLGISTLREVWFRDRRHYDVTYDKLSKALEGRGQL